MSEGEGKFLYTPRDALGFLIREAEGKILIDPHAKEHTTDQTLMIEDIRTKITDYASKKYSSNLTLRKLNEDLNFAQLAYLVMTEDMVLEGLKESKVRSLLRNKARQQQDKLQESKANLEKTLPIFPSEKKAFIDSQLVALYRFQKRIVSPTIYTPEPSERLLPIRARR